MSSFADWYCSPDYRSGFDLLSEQLELSLEQLHELKKFVLAYMNYFHSNGEFLGRLAINSFPIDSTFREEQEQSRVKMGIKEKQKEVPPTINLKYIYKQYIDRVALELELQLNLGANIDIHVYGKLNKFLKSNENHIRSSLTLLSDLLDDYEVAFKEMEKHKEKYEEMARLGEAAGRDHRIDHDSETQLASSVNDLALSKSTLPNESPLTSPKSDNVVRSETPRDGFVFPLTIGGVVTFENRERFVAFLSKAIRSIPSVHRKFPFPGYRNEIFQGEQLCDYLKTNKIYGFNPLRSNIEKFGQGLIDQKLLTGFGIFARRYRSEGMWYEWSEISIKLISEPQNEPTVVSLPSQKSSANFSDKLKSDTTQATTKSLNSVLKNFASTLSKPTFLEEALKNLEAEYNASYEEVQRLRHLLDMEILDRSKSIEKFEKTRIALIYQTLTKMLEIVYNHSMGSARSLNDFTKLFIEKFDKKEFYERDFESIFSKFSTGIFFPSMIPADALNNKTVDSSRSNTLYQNIKLSFNLYKDIALQLKVCSVDKDTVLCLRSVPVFFKRMIEFIDSSKASKDTSQLQELWCSPIDHQDYWSTKFEVINLIQKFTISEEINIYDEEAIELAILNNICNWLEGKSAERYMNFFKNWLLETSDSVVPCTVYDSILCIYDEKNDKSNDKRTRLAALKKVLAIIPRGNLSSLIFILESVCNAFEIGGIDGYGTTNKINESQESKGVDATEIAKSLNSIDTIGAVPFLHLILRPSIVKNSKGFKPPLSKYNCILMDLFELDLRKTLLEALIANEKSVLQRQENQKKSLAINKKPLERIISLEATRNSSHTRTSSKDKREPVTPTKSNHPPGPTSIPSIVSSGDGSGFALRPFKTGGTPRPSPSTSPIPHRRRGLSDVPIVDKDAIHLAPSE